MPNRKRVSDDMHVETIMHLTIPISGQGTKSEYSVTNGHHTTKLATTPYITTNAATTATAPTAQRSTPA